MTKKLTVENTNIVRMPQSGSPLSSRNKYKTDLTDWELVENDTYRAQGTSFKKLPSDFYEIKYNNEGKPLYKRLNVKTDDLINVKNDIFTSILSEIDEFWSKDVIFEKMGYLHYRGYLMFGPHGSGKTSLIQLITEDLLKKEGIVFVCNNYPDTFIEGVMDFRKVEPERPIICLFEDIDSLIKQYGDEELLQFLDGGFKVDHILNIATTNYPEKLDPRIIGRPRRFDRVIKIEYPDSATRLAYFKKKVTEKEAIKWAKETDGLSFASLAELVISVKCFNHSFNDTVETLRNIQEQTLSSEDDEEHKPLGFEPRKL